MGNVCCGCCWSCEGRVVPGTLPGSGTRLHTSKRPGLAIVVQNAESVPKSDVFRFGSASQFFKPIVSGDECHSDSFVVATVTDKQGKTLCKCETRVIASMGAHPEWNETLYLGELHGCEKPGELTLHLVLRDQDMLSADFIGEARLTLAELLKNQYHSLLMQDKKGNATLLHVKPPNVKKRLHLPQVAPPKPCEVHIELLAESIPQSLLGLAPWAQPSGERTIARPGDSSEKVREPRPLCLRSPERR